MSKKSRKTSLFDAFRYASAGFINTAKSERSFRIELVLAVLAIIAAVILQLQPVEWVLIIIFIVIVLVLELINSALESFIDLTTPDIHPLAKYAKDATAAAVLVAAVGAAVGGSFLFVSAGLRLWGG
ncbi:MAG: diacylglycerol kinase family protein [Coriobacteriia bacterium]|nr:diacylglycerol kinase family protein [Coriobacteriia bacterium]MCL2750077.1 diacylglycerol kinase family protein [Coriobacteriia bacterium]